MPRVAALGGALSRHRRRLRHGNGSVRQFRLHALDHFHKTIVRLLPQPVSRVEKSPQAKVAERGRYEEDDGAGEDIAFCCSREAVAQSVDEVEEGIQLGERLEGLRKAIDAVEGAGEEGEGDDDKTGERGDMLELFRPQADEGAEDGHQHGSAQRVVQDDEGVQEGELDEGQQRQHDENADKKSSRSTAQDDPQRQFGRAQRREQKVGDVALNLAHQ